MIDIHIRRARADESERLTAIATRAKASWGYPAEWLEHWKAELTLTPAYIERHFVLVAEIDNIVVGLCALEKEAGACALEHVWVDPPSHGKGIGRTLVESALARAKALNVARVSVLSDPFAEKFYAGMGAERIAEIPASMPGAPQRLLPLLEFKL